LLLIQSYSNDLWTMDRLNALAPQHGIEPFTKGSLQWVIHTVREHLGPRHIQRVRRVGYRFMDASLYQIKGSIESEKNRTTAVRTRLIRPIFKSPCWPVG